jgi:hypothetical protein
MTGVQGGSSFHENLGVPTSVRSRIGADHQSKRILILSKGSRKGVTKINMMVRDRTQAYGGVDMPPEKPRKCAIR